MLGRVPATGVFELPPMSVGGVGRAAYLAAFGLLFLLALALQFVKARALYGGGRESDRGERTNCPSCGARVPVEADTCDYCGEPTEE